MSNIPNHKQFDLEERTLQFAVQCRKLIKELPRTISNLEDGKQLIRSSGSIGANYIEANESLSKKDFVYRIRICRKEAKESIYWLNLLHTDSNSSSHTSISDLINEGTQLMKIFGAIITKCKS